MSQQLNVFKVVIDFVFHNEGHDLGQISYFSWLNSQ